MSTDLVIRLRGVIKRFGPITAVDGLDLDVPAGTCFGLLGPNGAGKSTTMRMLTGQARADAREIRGLGHELPGGPQQARGVFARISRVPGRERRAAVDRALQIANLTNRADTKVSELSGGMRRRLLIARGLIHEPRLVLLDEPTVGLDPQVRQGPRAVLGGAPPPGHTPL